MKCATCNESLGIQQTSGGQFFRLPCACERAGPCSKCKNHPKVVLLEADGVTIEATRCGRHMPDEVELPDLPETPEKVPVEKVPRKREAQVKASPEAESRKWGLQDGASSYVPGPAKFLDAGTSNAVAVLFDQEVVCTSCAYRHRMCDRLVTVMRQNESGLIWAQSTWCPNCKTEAFFKIP